MLGLCVGQANLKKSRALSAVCVWVVWAGPAPAVMLTVAAHSPVPHAGECDRSHPVHTDAAGMSLLLLLLSRCTVPLSPGRVRRSGWSHCQQGRRRRWWQQAAASWRSRQTSRWGRGVSGLSAGSCSLPLAPILLQRLLPLTALLLLVFAAPACWRSCCGCTA